MHIKSLWSYVNKELLAILSLLVVSTIAAVVYLTYTLLSLHSLTAKSSSSVGTAFVLQDLLINVQDVQTAVRGYVITGDSSFLKPYDVARERIPQDLKILRTNSTIPLSDAQINRIESLVDTKINAMEQAVAVRQHESYEAAALLIQSGQGDRTMDQLRKEINTISSISLQDIGPMQSRSEANLRRALLVAAAISLLVLSTCIAIAWFFKRAILQERALDSTKNEFLSLASHQLRTPATNVKQYIGLLLDGYMGPLTDEQKNALKVAYRNNESEISIMNNLLDVAKLDLDRIQLHKKVTNVMNVGRHVIREYKARAREHNQTILIEGPKQVMASVDEAYIKGVIENLVDNAIKYSKENTKIRVHIDREEDNVCIAVKDQGLGIKKRDYTKLFSKFSRLDNEFSANSEGSGLGLYWVKKVVSLHGGTIDISSKEGKGSTFTVKLPVR